MQNAHNSEALVSLTEVGAMNFLDWFIAVIVSHYGIANIPSWGSFSINVVLLDGSSRF